MVQDLQEIKDLAKKGLFRRSLGFLNAVLQSGPDAWEVWEAKANIFDNLGLIDHTARLLKLLIDAGAPPYFLVNYAIALLKVGRYQDSVDVSREYLRREPKGKHASAALSNIGIALTKLGKVKDAEVVFRESLNLEPSEPKTYVNLVALLRDQKRFIEGLKWVEIALQLIDGDNWRPRLLEDMAWLLLHLGRSEEAIDAATKCLLLQPDRIYTRYLLALGLSNMGRFEEALAETRTV